MAKFGVWIVAPQGDSHWRGLADAAGGIAHGLRELGHDVVLYHGDQPRAESGRQIVFNAHRLDRLPADAIIYNSEQVQVDDAWRVHSYTELLRSHVVWDYSQVNISRMRDHGVTRTAHCPLGYWPGLTTAASNKGRDHIDVLFFGSISERRKKILTEVAAAGLRVKALYGVYGAERDARIVDSKIVLNLHYYAKPITEIFRISYLFANKKCVVTEDGGSDPDLETFVRSGAVCVPASEIAAECVRLASDSASRAEVEERGFSAISQISQAEAVRRAVEVTL